MPDGPELRRAEARYARTLETLGDAVSFGALTGTRRSELEQLGAFFFGSPNAGAGEALTRPADVYLMVNASAIELQDFERFVDEVAPKDATVCAFNLEAR